VAAEELSFQAPSHRRPEPSAPGIDGVQLDTTCLDGTNSYSDGDTGIGHL
jgi:hypothetical protein